MGFRDKFVAPKQCYFRSPCKAKADRQAFRSLFERDWEVFVIKKDQQTGGHKWFTLCCESANVNVQNKALSAVCR